MLTEPAAQRRHHPWIVPLARHRGGHRVVAAALLAVFPARVRVLLGREPFAAESVRPVVSDDDFRLRQRKRHRPLRIPLQLLGGQRLGARLLRKLRLDLLVHRPRFVPQLDLQRVRVALALRRLQFLLLASQLQLDDGVDHLHLATNRPHLVVTRAVVLPAPASLRPVGLLALAKDVERVGVAGRGGRLQPAQARLTRLQPLLRPVLVHSLQQRRAAAHVA